jgi:hypothetical protein
VTRSRARSGELLTRGPLVSRFSFAIDVNEWGLHDRQERLPYARMETDAACSSEIAESDVWDERSDAVEDYRRRMDALGKDERRHVFVSGSRQPSLRFGQPTADR